MIHRTSSVRALIGLVFLALLAAGLSPLRADAQLRVRGWGYDLYGQIGDPPLYPGLYSDHSTPVLTAGVVNVRSIAAGALHSLALKTDGTVWYWGADSSERFPVAPAQVSGLQSIQAIAAGYGFSLALKNDGTVWTWGSNQYGQLGNGTSGSVNDNRAPISGLTGVTAIACGYTHSLAVKNDGTVWAWGDNFYGELGDGTTIQRSTPVQIPGLLNVRAVAAGNGYSMALLQDGTVWTWGDNIDGQIGDGTTTERHSPVPVTGLANITAIACNTDLCLALRSDGTVWTWGNNYFGLGDGATSYSPTPIQIPGLSNVTAIACGWMFNLALTRNGTVWTWGYNESGLGDGSSTMSLVPIRVPNLTDVRAIAAGIAHSLAVYADEDPDFDRDANHDLVWQNSSNGEGSIWYMNGPIWTGRYYPFANDGPAWKIVGVVDLNGDDNPGVIVQNSATGDVEVRLMNGATYVSASNIPLEWKIVGVTDINGDAKPDLLWQNAQTGDVTVWYMDGYFWTGNWDYIAHNIPTQWQIIGTGDMNHDGNHDLLWYNTATGDLVVWYMDGPIWTGNYDYIARNIPLAWKPVSIEDLNGDINADIVWQNSATGDAVVWYMDGPVWTDMYDYLARNLPPEWRIVRIH